MTDPYDPYDDDYDPDDDTGPDDDEDDDGGGGEGLQLLPDAPRDHVPPANAAEAMDRLRGLFAECEAGASFYLRLSLVEGIDFDIRCAYAGLAGRLVRTASNIAGRLDRAERAAPRQPPAPRPS